MLCAVLWAHRHLLMRWFCWFCQCWRFWWRRLVWCEVTGWGLRGILCSGIDFSGIFGEAILHLSVLTPNAPRAGCVSLHPPPWLSLLTPFRQELSVCVFAWHWDFIVAYSDCRFSCIALSRISPTWGTTPWLLPWCSRAGDTLEGTTFWVRLNVQCHVWQEASCFTLSFGLLLLMSFLS